LLQAKEKEKKNRLHPLKICPGNCHEPKISSKLALIIGLDSARARAEHQPPKKKNTARGRLCPQRWRVPGGMMRCDAFLG